MTNKEHKRERYKTHRYWYIPSASRVNYSLLVMESTGMMKMATGEESPEVKELGQKSPEPSTRVESAPYPPGRAPLSRG